MGLLHPVNGMQQLDWTLSWRSGQVPYSQSHASKVLNPPRIELDAFSHDAPKALRMLEAPLYTDSASM